MNHHIIVAAIVIFRVRKIAVETYATNNKLHLLFFFTIIFL